MIDFTVLENAIKDIIKENGNQEITGEILQNALLAMLTSIKEQTNQELTQIDTALHDKAHFVTKSDYDYIVGNGVYSGETRYNYILDEEPSSSASAPVDADGLKFIKPGMPNLIIDLEGMMNDYDEDDAIPFDEFFSINDENGYYSGDLQNRLLRYCRAGTHITIFKDGVQMTVPISTSFVTESGILKNAKIRAASYANLNIQSVTYEGFAFNLNFDFDNEVVFYGYAEI